MFIVKENSVVDPTLVNAPNNEVYPAVVIVPRLTHMLMVHVVSDPAAAGVLLKYADALDLNRSDLVMKLDPPLRLPSKDNIEENINYVVASPPTTH